MKSRPYRIQEIFVEKFRCFKEQRIVRLTPLTLLIGDNSAGKTSFLAALRLVWDIAYRKVEPDFRQIPYDLGGFSDVAYNSGSRRYPTKSFEFGFTTQNEISTPLKFSATFREHSGAPLPTNIIWSSDKIWLKRCVSLDGHAYTDFGIHDSSWRFLNPERRYESSVADFLLSVVLRLVYSSRGRDSSFGTIEPLNGSPIFPTDRELDSLLDGLDFFPASDLLEKRPFASAPTSAYPQRIYDPVETSLDGEKQIARYLADQFRNIDQRNEFRDRLEKFGRNAGLFDEISVRYLGKRASSPFQLQIRNFSETHRRGPRRNLIDVGYGVSQALSLVAELLRPDGSYTFLLQQPEVHLHPSAQAAFGSLFCEMAASGRQLIVETHSEYIVDRIRMDLRDRQTMLTPDDVSILFFERSGLDVHIHSLRFDEQGNVIGAPDGYGQFFMDEMRRSVGL